MRDRIITAQDASQDRDLRVVHTLLVVFSRL